MDQNWDRSRTLTHKRINLQIYIKNIKNNHIAKLTKKLQNVTIFNLLLRLIRPKAHFLYI